MSCIPSTPHLQSIVPNKLVQKLPLAYIDPLSREGNLLQNSRRTIRHPCEVFLEVFLIASLLVLHPTNLAIVARTLCILSYTPDLMLPRKLQKRVHLTCVHRRPPPGAVAAAADGKRLGHALALFGKVEGGCPHCYHAAKVRVQELVVLELAAREV